MADIEKLEKWMVAYGTAVRAGLITPCLEDETAIRKRMGLPDTPDAVKSDWVATNGVRKPNTIRTAKEVEEGETDIEENANDET